jgi:hypothetical protein
MHAAPPSCASLAEWNASSLTLTAFGAREVGARAQLRLNVDDLIEPENVENHSHLVRRGDDDQPPTKPLEPFVHMQ